MRDSDGYFNWPTEHIHQQRIRNRDEDCRHLQGAKLGTQRRDRTASGSQAHSNPPIFIGIARTADVDRYLRGIDHDDISGLSYHPFQVSYDHTERPPPRPSPPAQRFWVKSTTGDGTVALDWKPRPGSWRAVIMNTDNSRGVNADVKVRRPHLAALVAGRRTSRCECPRGLRRSCSLLPRTSVTKRHDDEEGGATLRLPLFPVSRATSLPAQ